jgi:hypothetical protein
MGKTYWQLYHMYVFLICGIAALFGAIGYKYKMGNPNFFLSFTYIELMDKTTYLNHYYLSQLSVLYFCFLPANCYFSVDAYKNEKLIRKKYQLGILTYLNLLLRVYFYAGLLS